MAAHRDFADYCCELLASVGPCVPKRMFGGWGISVDGLTIAIIGDLGSGQKLWLKGSDDTRAQFEAAGGARFTYTSTQDGVPLSRGMNYFSAPEDAMDSPDAMATWARLAMQCALTARAAKPAKSSKPRATKQATKQATGAKAGKKLISPVISDLVQKRKKPKI